VLHQIGIGALGPVFRTYEPTRDRLVAVKVFRLDIVPEQAQALADALTRATQASLFHPSIVEPIASGVEGTVAYRAEEYVAAESLDVAMRHYAPATIDKALPFITQLAGAVDFARATGIGHGGLHPRDIFVTPDEARATGFGVVEALEQVGVRAPVRRPYTAPERIAGGAWGTPADVFSLAAIAFELLTARRPAGTGAQIGALPDGAWSAALHRVLARAMDEDPSRRYPTALAFAAALEAAGRGDTAPQPADIPAPAVAPSRVAPPSAAVAPTAATRAQDTRDAGALHDSLTRHVPPVVPTPGEFEIEDELDPVHEALDDIAAERDADEAHAAPTLFDDVDESASEDVIGETSADLGAFEHVAAPTAGRFADDFVAEQIDADTLSPIEAPHEAADMSVPPEPGYAPLPSTRNGGDEMDVLDGSERARPAVFPYAATLVLGLLIGFAAAYFVLSRDRLPPQEVSTAAPVSPAPSAAGSGPATPDKAGQYSEQKVTSPPPSTATPPRAATPPPVPNETAAAAPSRSEPTAKRGTLVVRSTPSRASVTLNGTWRGRTPLTLDGLTFGKYVVRVVQPGFRVAREDFTLNAGDTEHTFNARLEREGRGAFPSRGGAGLGGTESAAPGSYTGSLFVDSRPRGAMVIVDGRSIGQTPVMLPNVAVGAHVVRIEMSGKKPWTSSTRVASGEIARVTGSLEDK
jgi:hypothetical protein